MEKKVRMFTLDIMLSSEELQSMFCLSAGLPSFSIVSVCSEFLLSIASDLARTVLHFQLQIIL